MTQFDENPQEASTARDNQLTVLLDARTGTVRVAPDAREIRELVETARRAQESGDVRLLAASTA